MQVNDAFRLISARAAARFLAVLVLALLLAGCGNAEFEIARQNAEIGERLRLNAIPRHGEIVTLRWDETQPGRFCLNVRRISPNTYYKSATQPDVRRIGCQEDFS